MANRRIEELRAKTAIMLAEMREQPEDPNPPVLKIRTAVGLMANVQLQRGIMDELIAELLSPVSPRKQHDMLLRINDALRKLAS